MGPLNPVLGPCPEGAEGTGGHRPTSLIYLTSPDAVAGAIVGPSSNQGGFLRQTWTLWLDGDDVPQDVNATLWSSPDGHLWAPCAQYQKRIPGPGGDVFDVPIAAYFYVTVDRSWSGSPNRHALNSAIQSTR